MSDGDREGWHCRLEVVEEGVKIAVVKTVARSEVTFQQHLKMVKALALEKYLGKSIPGSGEPKSKPSGWDAPCLLEGQPRWRGPEPARVTGEQRSGRNRDTGSAGPGLGFCAVRSGSRWWLKQGRDRARPTL